MSLRRAGGASVGAVGLSLATLFLFSQPPAPGRAGTQSSCPVSTFTSNDVPKAIPDPGTAESALAVPAGDPVAAVAVRVTLAHPFDSDLKLELVSPAGKVVLLAEAVGMWGHDFTSTVFDDAASGSILSQLPPFTGTFRPAEPLAAFIGSARAGTWTLRVTDLRARYAGQLVSWGLDITSCAAPVAPPAKPVGAPDPPPLPTGVPAGHIPAEGTIITVTSNGDDDDGHTLSVAALLADPGPDGTISLREAIEATNFDPGTYTIRFAPTLAGKSIDVAAPLPPLQGGGVLIDGDIDGDGRPDVTITDNSGNGGLCGLTVLSSNNRVHALAIRGFPCGIEFSTPSKPGPAPSNLTLARNIVTGVGVTSKALAGNGFAQGILLHPNFGHPECDQAACDTHNTWSDIRFVGNSITSGQNAIDFTLTGTIGDAIERVTVANNNIQIGAPQSTINSSAVGLAAGYPKGGDNRLSDNRISDALVAYNSIDAAGHSFAITAAAGSACGANNLVEDLGVLGNRVHFAGVPAIPEAARGFQFAISDGCGPTGPPQNSDIVRRVRIIGNVFAGQDDAGVLAGEGCCVGNGSSLVTDLRIADNLIQGIVPPQALNPWGIEVGGHTNVSNVIIDSNTVEQETTDPATDHVADLAGGGIALVGGLGSGALYGSTTSIQNVSITNNRIDTDLAGVTLLGGGPSDQARTFDTYGHSVSGVVLRGNVIVRSPALALRWDPQVKGIQLLGGLGGPPPATDWGKTTSNSVIDIGLAGNLVAGVLDDVSVRSNFGQGASGNVAELGRPPRPTIDLVPHPRSPRSEAAR